MQGYLLFKSDVEPSSQLWELGDRILSPWKTGREIVFNLPARETISEVEL